MTQIKVKLPSAKITSILILAIAISLIGCNTTPTADSAEPITRQSCESDPAFAFIPEGQFIIGSNNRERDFGYRISAQAIANTPKSIKQAEQKLRQTGWFDRETSPQIKSLPGFCLSRNLVTNQEYLEFVRATEHPLPNISELEYQQQGFLVHPYSKVQEFLWRNDTYPPNTGNHPVVLVSYQDALAYATWKGKQTGARYRLPTAEEWEKAARGKEGRYFPWGNEWNNAATNTGTSRLNYTSAIGTFPLSKSIYGVEDMAGNVFEYTSSPKRAENQVIMKGCSWDDLPGFCRAAYQHTRPVDSRHILFGFRLIKEY